MSKLLRLPLTLLAVLAAMLFLPGLAWAASPTAEQCAANPTLTGCAGQAGAGTGTSTGQAPSGTTTGQPTGQTGPVTNTGGGTQGQTPPGQQQAQQPQSLAVVPFVAPTDPGPVVGLGQVPTAPPNFCDQLPKNPICTGTNPPSGPLTCDQLAKLLNLPGGCPQNFSCADLASLLGLTCPAGPPDCATLAALFHLQGCPQPPTSCQDFAKMFGVQDCSQLPCLDTSKLPQQARDGLQQLFDGLKNIGIKQCPAPPTTGGGTTARSGQSSTTTNQTPAQQQTGPYYANCTDAKAQGVSNIPQGSPGYRPELDADHDGFACDETQKPVAQTAQPNGHLAYTGLEIAPQLNVAWTLLVLGAGLLILGRRRA